MEGVLVIVNIYKNLNQVMKITEEWEYMMFISPAVGMEFCYIADILADIVISLSCCIILLHRSSLEAKARIYEKMTSAREVPGNR